LFERKKNIHWLKNSSNEQVKIISQTTMVPATAKKATVTRPACLEASNPTFCDATDHGMEYSSEANNDDIETSIATCLVLH
jgi:hypothetical protein